MAERQWKTRGSTRAKQKAMEERPLVAEGTRPEAEDLQVEEPPLPEVGTCGAGGPARA